MKWVDVIGPTGVGKSTLCDPISHPRDFPHPPIAIPPHWRKFTALARRLCDDAAANGHADTWRMTQNAIWRMIAIEQKEDAGVYCNVGLGLRGVSIAWRLPDPAAIAEFYELMPVSIGFAALIADDDTLRNRNIERGKTIPKKQRAPLAVRMHRVMPLAISAIKARGVPMIEIDVTEEVVGNVERLRAFAGLAPLAAVA